MTPREIAEIGKEREERRGGWRREEVVEEEDRRVEGRRGLEAPSVMTVLAFLLQEGLESQLNHPDFILTDLAKPEVCVTDHAVHA